MVHIRITFEVGVSIGIVFQPLRLRVCVSVCVRALVCMCGVPRPESRRTIFPSPRLLLEFSSSNRP